MSGGLMERSEALKIKEDIKNRSSLPFLRRLGSKAIGLPDELRLKRYEKLSASGRIASLASHAMAATFNIGVEIEKGNRAKAFDKYGINSSSQTIKNREGITREASIPLAIEVGSKEAGLFAYIFAAKRDERIFDSSASEPIVLEAGIFSNADTDYPFSRHFRKTGLGLYIRKDDEPAQTIVLSTESINNLPVEQQEILEGFVLDVKNNAQEIFSDINVSWIDRAAEHVGVEA